MDDDVRPPAADRLADQAMVVTFAFACLCVDEIHPKLKR
jgi:hypothetical protein